MKKLLRRFANWMYYQFGGPIADPAWALPQETLDLLFHNTCFDSFKVRKPLPFRTGNEIKFFTYQLPEDSVVYTRIPGERVFQCGTGEMGTLWWSRDSEHDPINEDSDAIKAHGGLA